MSKATKPKGLKGFEKWFKSNKSFNSPTESQKDFVWHRACMVGWRSALEWVLNDVDGYCCGDIDSHDEFQPCPRTTIIKKELED